MTAGSPPELESLLLCFRECAKYILFEVKLVLTLTRFNVDSLIVHLNTSCIFICLHFGFL
jgi:hypothetical protein